MAQSFAGKRVLVTGGSSGIGKATSIMFAKAGAQVACIASSDRAKAAAVAEEAGQISGKIVPFVGDVSDWNKARKLVGEVEAAFGGIDVLVTAAGIFLPTPTGGSDRAVVENTVSVNLVGTMATVEAVAPKMKANGGGKIVCIASIAGLVGIGSYSAYCATKAGIIGMVKAMAIDLAPHGININAIAPGNTETPINEDIRTDPKLRHVYDLMKSRTPSKRVFSKAEEIARAALYLASDDSVAMYGSTMVLDEGITAGI